jgi:ABC-type multidrug transport system fused ATPase/permease subunit
MEGGRIRQQGSHAQLVRQEDGPYLRLMRSQMAGGATSVEQAAA